MPSSEALLSPRSEGNYISSARPSVGHQTDSTNRRLTCQGALTPIEDRRRPDETDAVTTQAGR